MRIYTDELSPEGIRAENESARRREAERGYPYNRLPGKGSRIATGEEPDFAAPPGWVILSDLGSKKTVTKGGIELPIPDFKLINVGRVVSAGDWRSKRTGSRGGPAGWLKSGDIVCFWGQNPLVIPHPSDPNLVAVLSDDVVSIPQQRYDELAKWQAQNLEGSR